MADIKILHADCLAIEYYVNNDGVEVWIGVKEK